MTADPTHEAENLLALWEVQQAHYVSQHEQRVGLMVDILERTIPADGLILDLASGPGSISSRALERMPRLTSIAVDYDPVLTALGAEALGRFGDRVSFHDVDLWDVDWFSVLGGRRPDAVLSSTALHWLPASTLARVYSDLAGIVKPGGVFMNADHLRHLEGRPLFEELSAADDAATQQAGRDAGALTWDEWWQRVIDVPRFGALAPERERRFSERPPNPELSLGFHVEALRTAGFAEAGPVWQYFDDYIVLARR